VALGIKHGGAPWPSAGLPGLRLARSTMHHHGWGFAQKKAGSVGILTDGLVEIGAA
jgi:hypothetical protein